MSKEQQSEMQSQRQKKRLLVLGRMTLFLTPIVGVLGCLVLFFVGRLTQSLLPVVIFAGIIITLIIASPLVGVLLMDLSGLWPAKREK